MNWYNVVANLNQVAADTRSNFSQVTASIKNSPLDLRKGSLPAGKKNSETHNWSLGLVESCMELAEALSHRLVLEVQARTAHREKLFTALVIYASLRPPYPDSDSSISTGETRTIDISNNCQTFSPLGFLSEVRFELRTKN